MPGFKIITQDGAVDGKMKALGELLHIAGVPCVVMYYGADAVCRRFFLSYPNMLLQIGA